MGDEAIVIEGWEAAYSVETQDAVILDNNQ